MKEGTWRTIAIVCMILLLCETFLIIYGIKAYNDESKDTKICYYKICGEHPYAELVDGVCYCYNHDLDGDFILVDKKVMK